MFVVTKCFFEAGFVVTKGFFEAEFAVTKDVFEDEFLGTSYDYPMNIKNMILSDKVFIKK